MKYRAIAFDLGGVLLDSEEAHENAARRAASDFGLSVPEEKWQRIRGGAYEDLFVQILALPVNARYGLKPMQVVLRAYDYYHEEVRRSARLFEGAIEVLESARAMFASVTVATSSEWRFVETSLKHFNLAGYFDGIISGDHVTQKKPAPEAFLVAAWLLGVSPASMIAVEDSTHGVRAAKLARAHVIGLATSRSPQALREAGAHHVASSHRDLVAYFDALKRSGRIAGPTADGDAPHFQESTY